MRTALFLVALLPGLAHSQIYQYEDPDTGSKKLTNIRPAWYSTETRNSGPRTLVIVHGIVIDDTAKAQDKDLAQRASEKAAEYYSWVEERRLATLRQFATRAEPASSTPAPPPLPSASTLAGHMVNATILKLRAQAAAAREGLDLRFEQPPAESPAYSRSLQGRPDGFGGTTWSDGAGRTIVRCREDPFGTTKCDP